MSSTSQRQAAENWANVGVEMENGWWGLVGPTRVTVKWAGTVEFGLERVLYFFLFFSKFQFPFQISILDSN